MTDDPSDLAEFIREHSTPYNPETDAYRRPPFARPVKAGKNSQTNRRGMPQ